MTKESIEEEMNREAYADDVAARTTFLATVFSLKEKLDDLLNPEHVGILT